MSISVADRRQEWRERQIRVPRRAVIGSLMLVVSAGLVVSTAVRAAGRPSEREAPPFGELWVGTATTAGTLAEIDPAMSNLFFGGKASVMLGGAEGAVTAMAWASQAAFAADLAAGRIPESVRVVLYDPEGWQATPAAERRAPAAAMQAFGELARSNGYVAVITPHPSLVTVPDAVCGAWEGETMQAAYLRCGIQADAARYADVVEVQGQYLETDVVAYRAFIDAAVQQARRANPSVTVLSGLSTNFTDDPAVVYAAWRSVLEVVDGHYLNVPGGIRPRVAVDFLQMVAGTPD
jgi:hypothetical protein